MADGGGVVGGGTSVGILLQYSRTMYILTDCANICVEGWRGCSSRSYDHKKD